MQQYPVRFMAAWAVVGAIAIAALVGFVAVMFTPVTPVAHKSDVRSGLGPTKTSELVKEAEKNIAAQASQAGVTITSQKLRKVTHPDGNTVEVYVDVATVEVGPVSLKVEFHKGIYSITGVSQV